MANSRKRPRGALAAALAAVALVALMLATGASARVDRGQETINWTFMSIVPPVTKGSSVGNFHKAFAAEVAAKTNGALVITVKSPGELPYSPAATLSTVGANRVQIGDGAAFISGESKAAALTMMPFLISTQKEFIASLKVLRPSLTADFNRFGVTSLYTYMWPLQVVWGNGGEPKSLADLAGMKIRSSSAEQAYFFDKIGANPVTLTTAEVAPSLQRGVVTGVATAGYNAFPLGWGQLVKWAYLQPINIVPGFVVINKEALAGLPANLRTTLLQVAAKWQAKLRAQIPRAEGKYRAGMVGQGVKLIPAKAGDQKRGVSIMAPYWTTWASDNNLTPQLAAVRRVLGR
jgi:TRAP-type C4-dicarboxylate transport system substrate-binding protein